MKTAPWLEIDLEKIQHNASTLVGRLAKRGISVTGVTKAALGSPVVARAMLRAGVRSLGDSRIENIERMRLSGIKSKMTLLRSPMLSQVERVVRHADVSFNTEVEIIRALSLAAQRSGREHGVVLMVELGDLREGIMPADLVSTVRKIRDIKNIVIHGIGANLACRSGVVPDKENMAELSSLAEAVESTFGLALGTVSGGNSANLDWALSGEDTGRVNDLRLGEAILLGCEPLHRRPIEGLHTDAFTLIAEVVESKVKPTMPWGQFAQNAFGENGSLKDRGLIPQSILAIGRQDTDPDGLTPPEGIKILGASSDHLIVESFLPIGAEVAFQLNYSSLLRAMTSPFIAQYFSNNEEPAVVTFASA